MAGRKTKSVHSNTGDASLAKPDITVKPWALVAKEIKFRKKDLESLYQVSRFLNKDTRQRVGLLLKIPVFIQDPLVALENPTLGVQTIELRLDTSLFDGPTSARVAVVDYDADTQTLLESVKWNEKKGWFYTPSGVALPDAPQDLSTVKDPLKYEKEYREFIQDVLKNPYFHQVNAWAIVQRVLEFYEDSQALGRPIPWGFDGNRLLVVPHVGYGENAFYDQSTKSLQFYYFGDEASPKYTCLSHDILAHECGHAILDGIRPLYNENPSVQTSAFHEFIGDLTAILLALFNSDIRQFVAKKTQANLRKDKILSSIAEEFGQDIYNRPYLRSASNDHTMDDVEIKNSSSAHQISQVLTGAMFEILIGIAQSHMDKNLPVSEEESSNADNIPPGSRKPRKVTPLQAMWWAADRFRRVALQPLDLCPPCDIQFIDYAKSVMRNDILTNPVDAEGYRGIMLKVFHERKLCTCKYKPGGPLPLDCEFLDAVFQPKQEFVHHSIDRVSRSRTAAYYFLNDNREVLRIPLHQDIVISDLYDNSKLGDMAERLPGQVVIEYVWKEELEFKDQAGRKFGWLAGKKAAMYCGGTLVFDDRGNLLSWFRKPGTQLVDKVRETDIRKKEKPTKLELAQLADMEIGRKRADAFLTQIYEKLKKGQIGLADEHGGGLPRELQRPVTAFESNGVVHFTNTPHLRKDEKESEAVWQRSF